MGNMKLKKEKEKNELVVGGALRYHEPPVHSADHTKSWPPFPNSLIG